MSRRGPVLTQGLEQVQIIVRFVANWKRFVSESAVPRGEINKLVCRIARSRVEVTGLYALNVSIYIRGCSSSFRLMGTFFIVVKSYVTSVGAGQLIQKKVPYENWQRMNVFSLPYRQDPIDLIVAFSIAYTCRMF